jgi:hypothetical protein
MLDTGYKMQDAGCKEQVISDRLSVKKDARCRMHNFLKEWNFNLIF